MTDQYDPIDWGAPPDLRRAGPLYRAPIDRDYVPPKPLGALRPHNEPRIRLLEPHAELERLRLATLDEPESKKVDQYAARMEAIKAAKARGLAMMNRGKKQ